MSKAFVKDDAEVPELVPVRTQVLPVTSRGHQAFVAERGDAEARGDAHRAQQLSALLASVEVVQGALDARGGAGFGCAVVLEGAAGRRARYELVGPDEIDAAKKRVTLASPVGQALAGARVGDEIDLPRAGGSEPWTVVAVELLPAVP